MTWTELPIEIKLAMFLNQTLQGNAHNKEPFEKKIEADKDEGGFYWESSIEGEDFWIEILEYGNISHFYTKYPKIQVEIDSPQKVSECDTFCRKSLLGAKGIIRNKIKQNKKRIKILKDALDILLEE